MSRAVAIALLLLPALTLVPIAAGDAWGDAPKKLPPAEGARYDPENTVAISQFMETVSKGNEKYASKDYTGAIDLFKKAIQLAPKNALGPYLLAEAYLANGNLGEADGAIAQAQEIAPTDHKQAPLRARVLFLRADIYERQKKWDLARTTWQSYVEVAAKVGDAGAFPQSGAERLRVLQKVIDQEKRYAPVRERIAADKADAGANAAKKK